MKKSALFQIIVFIITLILIQASAHARKYPMIPVITGIETLYDVWGTSAKNVYAVGQIGTILHYDGETVTPMESNTYFELRGIWGTSADNIFAVGGGGTIIRYDGKEWTPMNSGSDAWLNGVWGGSGSDVFAVGDGGAILHYDGKEWNRMSSGTDKNLLGVWGNTGTDVFAVGDGSVILHYGGSGWISMNSGLSRDSHLAGVWGNSGTDVFAVGFWDGVILHYDGRTWTRSGGSAGNYLLDLWGHPAGTGPGSDVFAVGRSLYGYDNSLLHHDGSEWMPAEFDSRAFLNGVWGHPAENGSGYDIFAVGECGTIIHYDGNRRTVITGDICDDFEQVHGSSASDLFAVGGARSVTGSGVILHYDGSAWKPEGNFGDYDLFYDIWEYTAENHSERFVVGYSAGYSGVILHHDGVAWMQMDSGTERVLKSVWGYPAENRPGPEIFAVGMLGTILHYDGEAWTLMDSGTENPLLDVWGHPAENYPGADVFTVGSFGTILHYDGEEWKQMDSGTKNTLYGVWGHPAENRLGLEIFAVGSFGTILHYDGEEWKQTDSGTKNRLWGVWGHPAENRLGTDVFAAGEYGTILHYDGMAWTRVQSFTKEKLNGAWVSPVGGLPGSELFVSGGHVTMPGIALLRYRYFAIGLVLPENVKEGSGSVQGEIRVRDSPAEDVPVSLVSGDISEFVVPDTIVIPAGETSAFFDISIRDDLLRDGSRYVSVTASADGYFSARATVRSDDNETADIRLSLPPDAKEGDGTLTGEILLCKPGSEPDCTPLIAEKDIVVSLKSDNTAAVRVPLRVTVPAGRAGIAFDMTISDDTEIDDAQTATVTASVEGWTSGSAVTQVADNDRYVLSVAVPDDVTEGDGMLSAGGTVYLSEPYPSDVTVFILSEAPSELTVPHTVVIPAGQTSAVFDLTVREDALPDGDQTIVIRASSPDWTSGKADISVRDTDVKLDTMHVSPHIYGIWGNSGTNIFAVAWLGTILHYDGMAWTLMRGGDDDSEWLSDVWGHPAENGLGTEVFAVGRGGSILHYDNTEWTRMNSGTEQTIEGIWGSSENDVFAVGDNGVILHYDGKTWTLQDSGTDRWLENVWGYPAESRSGFEVFVVGESGTILHNDGTAWIQTESGTDQWLLDVWGRPAENGHGYEMFAVGYEGTIIHYDGKSWMPMESGTDRKLRGVGGTETDVFVVGMDGLILHYDGAAWTEMKSGTDTLFQSVFACPPENDAEGMPANAYAVGYNGVILHYDGVHWNPAKVYEHIFFEDIRNMSDQTGSVRDAVAVGNNGAILRYDGTDWHRTANGTDWQMNLNGVWAASSSPSGIPSGHEIFAVGELGTILYFDGTDWHKTENVTDRQLNDVWGSSVSDVHAVGNEGTILHYDGSAWTPADIVTDANLNGIWGVADESGADPEIFAVGNSGTILHRRGESGWIPMNSGTENDLLGVWGHESGNVEQGVIRAFAVGHNGTVLHYDGTAWTPMDSGISLWIYDVWGNSGTDVFAAVEQITLHYDGIKWTVINKFPFFRSIHGNSGGDVFFAGEYGTIYHYSAFTVTIPETAAEGAGILPGTVRIPAPRETDLAVKMTSFDTSEVTVPASVTIPAGQTSVPFELHVSDDNLTDGTQTVAVIATAPGDKILNGGRTEIRITDNETAVLNLSLPETANEGDETISGFVSMSEPAGKDIAVTLKETGFFQKTRFLTVTIPKGETTAEFTLSITDDTEFDGTQPASVTATVGNWTSATTAVAVSDNEVPELALALPQEVSENDGNLSETGTVSIPGTLAYNLNIALYSNDTTESSVPETIIIPAGELSAFFDLTVADDPEIDGTQTVTVTASADGWTPAEAHVRVNDNDPGILQFSADRYMALTGRKEIPVTVIRTGSSSGEISVEYIVAAPENLQDFGSPEDLSGILVFADNETSRTFAIATEDLRGFGNPAGLSCVLNLASPGRGASIGNPGTALLIIAESAAWQQTEIPAEHPVRDIWGTGHSDVFAAGWGGTILHYNGTGWTHMSHEAAETVSFEAVWGFSSDEVFAAGHKGVIFRYNGQKWSPMQTGTQANLYGIWGSSESDIFAAGTSTILHYDGTEWNSTEIAADLRAVWGSSPSDIFASGCEGTVLHYDGTAWTRMETGTDANLYSIWGRSPADVYTAGSFGTILHYDGIAWTRMETGTETPVLFLADIWGFPQSPDIYTAGHNGTILHYSGRTWNKMETGTGVTLKTLWGNCNLDIYAAGESGTILHYALE